MIKTPAMSPTASQNTEIVRLPTEWPYRLAGTTFVLVIVLFLAMVIVTIKDELVSKQIDSWKNDFFEFTSKNGFLIDDILISGRNRTLIKELEQAIGVDRSNNILQIDLQEMRHRIEQLPWVRKAALKRSFFPNLLQINIEEKQIGAIWQHHEKFYPIDFDGHIIQADFRSQSPILLIVGDKAPENVKDLLLGIYAQDSKNFQRIKVANFISGRRWDLILDDIQEGITVKLPEENPAKAWQKLMKLNASKGILKRKLTIIDLRLQDKVIVKLKKSPMEKPSLVKTKELKL